MTAPSATSAQPVVVASGGWIRGTFEGHYEATGAASLGAPQPHGARVLGLRILRGLVRGARPSAPPPSTKSGDPERAPIVQDVLPGTWVELGGVDDQGRQRVHELVLHDVHVVDWVAEPLLDEGPRARGTLRGTLYARVGANAVVSPWAGLLRALRFLALAALCLTFIGVPLCGTGVGIGPFGFSCGRGCAGAGVNGCGTGGAGCGAGCGDDDGDGPMPEGLRTPLPPRAATDGGPVLVDDAPGRRFGADEALADPAAYFAACGQPLTLSADVLFDLNDDTLKPKAVPHLKKVSRLLKEEGGTFTLAIVGHADPSGDAAHNLDLSARRARRVAKWLVDDGAVDFRRVAVTGRGEEQPIVPANAGPALQKYNRRVEISVQCPPPSRDGGSP